MTKALLTISSVAAVVFSGVVGYQAASEVIDVYQVHDTTIIVYTNPVGR